MLACANIQPNAKVKLNLNDPVLTFSMEFIQLQINLAQAFNVYAAGSDVVDHWHRIIDADYAFGRLLHIFGCIPWLVYVLGGKVLFEFQF